MPQTRITIDVLEKRFGLPANRITGTVSVYTGPAMPRLVVLKTVSQKENQMLQFKLQLPVPTVSDVVAQEVSVTIANGNPIVLIMTPGAEVIDPQLEGEANAEVATSLIDIDGSDNRSEPRNQVFVLTDTIAPPQPGEISLTVTSQT